MTNIMLRGKRIDGCGWIYGSLLQNEDMSVIVVWFEESAYCGIADCPYTHGAIGFEVDPETVSRYTGWKDVKGKEVYEGDIAACDYDCIGTIYWDEEAAGFYYSILYEDGSTIEEPIHEYIEYMKVIGNMYDNPELLEVEK